MLIRYKKAYEKIAMGLLSLMPSEKDIKKLLETIHCYEKNDHWNLYLWKRDDEYVGVVGVIIENNVAMIQHISVIPSYRGEGIARQMLQELKSQDTYQKILANEETNEFVRRCISIDGEVDGM